MQWVLVIGLGWIVIAVLAGVVIGRAIRLASESEPRTSGITQRHAPRGQLGRRPSPATGEHRAPGRSGDRPPDQPAVGS